MLINVDNLSFAYGIDEILKNAKFQLKEKEKVGIVGPNGIGKSTFIKLLVGQLEPDAGSIVISQGTTIGHLEQEIDFDQNLTLNELFYGLFEEDRKKVRRLREIEEQMVKAQDEELEQLYEEYDSLQELIDRENIYSNESFLRGMIKGLKLSDDDLNKTFNTLSGGEKTKAILAMILLKSPDLLILDEPTNYLDIQTLNWLENTLRNYQGSVLVISHDRFFLNNVCSRIVELEAGKLNSYDGNYDNYAYRKNIERSEQNKLYQIALKEAQRQKNIIKRYKDINSKQSSKHARSREKALSKLEIPDAPVSQKEVLFYFNPKIRSGDEVLKVSNLTKSYSDKVLFKDLSFLIKRRDRVGIIGGNGIGKTTLFNILRKTVKADSGKVEFGSKVHYAFFDQESSDLRDYEDYNLIEIIRESNLEMSDGEIRNFLATFLFTGDDIFKLVRELSGGEKVRIKLAQLVLSNANFLIMDEPTNHIDMATKEILENVLLNYQGTLLFISHDRYFLNKIADRLIEFTPEGITEYPGNYDYYLNKRNQTNEELQEKPVLSKTATQKLKRKTREFRQKKAELENAVRNVEKESERAEKRIKEIEEIMIDPAFYKSNDSNEIIKEYHSLKEETKRLLDKWEELSIELEDFLDGG